MQSAEQGKVFFCVGAMVGITFSGNHKRLWTFLEYVEIMPLNTRESMLRALSTSAHTAKRY